MHVYMYTKNPLLVYVFADGGSSCESTVSTAVGHCQGIQEWICVSCMHMPLSGSGAT